MDDEIETLKRIYGCFNRRDIDGVLAALAPDVAWANGMEGGHVHGHAAVRDYWERQWAVVSPHVEPMGFTAAADGPVVVQVRQTVRDLQGQPLQGQEHGLHDRTIGHVFHFRDGRVVRFDIRDLVDPRDKGGEPVPTMMIATYQPGEEQKAAPPEAWRAVAEQIAALDGLRWKYWLRPGVDGAMGGIYLFGTPDQARAGGAAVEQSLAGAGAGAITLRFFEVDAGLSALTRGTAGLSA